MPTSGPLYLGWQNVRKARAGTLYQTVLTPDPDDLCKPLVWWSVWMLRSR